MVWGVLVYGKYWKNKCKHFNILLCREYTYIICHLFILYLLILGLHNISVLLCQLWQWTHCERLRFYTRGFSLDKWKILSVANSTLKCIVIYLFFFGSFLCPFKNISFSNATMLKIISVFLYYTVECQNWVHIILVYLSQVKINCNLYFLILCSPIIYTILYLQIMAAGVAICYCICILS